jgi:hypothetical protein
MALCNDPDAVWVTVAILVFSSIPFKCFWGLGRDGGRPDKARIRSFSTRLVCKLLPGVPRNSAFRLDSHGMELATHPAIAI